MHLLRKFENYRAFRFTYSNATQIKARKSLRKMLKFSKFQKVYRYLCPIVLKICDSHHYQCKPASLSVSMSTKIKQTLVSAQCTVAESSVIQLPQQKCKSQQNYKQTVFKNFVYFLQIDVQLGFDLSSNSTNVHV